MIVLRLVFHAFSWKSNVRLHKQNVLKNMMCHSINLLYYYVSLCRCIITVNDHVRFTSAHFLPHKYAIHVKCHTFHHLKMEKRLALRSFSLNIATRGPYLPTVPSICRHLAESINLCTKRVIDVNQFQRQIQCHNSVSQSIKCPRNVALFI